MNTNSGEDWIWNLKKKKMEKYTILSMLYQRSLSPSSHCRNQWKTAANQGAELQKQDELKW